MNVDITLAGILPAAEPNIGREERAVSAALAATLGAFAASRRRDEAPAALALGLAAGYLGWRAATGHCAAYEAIGVTTVDRPLPHRFHREGDPRLEVRRSITVNRAPQDVYDFWRDLTNLPRFMARVDSVTTEGDRSHWVVDAPLGGQLEWDAEITLDVSGEAIAWRTLPGADVENEGSVSFRAAAGGRGTEVRVLLRYLPPAGRAGAALARLLHEDPDRLLAEDLRRLRQLLEAGELPTTTGQPSGRGEKR